MLCRAVFRAGLVPLALAGWLLAGCTGTPLRRDVIAQARPGGQVAFDIVKVDGAVLRTLKAEQPPPFYRRFRPYQPPPVLTIAVGDTISVIIWEAGASGLFGTAPTELSLPPAIGTPPAEGAVPPQAGTAPPGQNSAGSVLGALLGEAPEQNAPSDNESAPEPPSNTGEQPSKAAKVPGAAPLLLPEEAPSGGGFAARIPDQTVGPDGAITVPYAGRIKVAGLTPDEVQKRVQTLLAARAVNPQVLVIDRRSPANSVSVEGETLGGKRVPLPLGGARLLQVIAAAGGAQAPPYQTFVRLSRGGATATVPLATLIADPQEDIFAKPGDVVTLVHRRRTFSVFGATGKNRQIAFDSERLSLSEALGKAGGLLDARADPRAVFLFRYEPDGIVRALHQPVAAGAPMGISPIAYRLDMREAKSVLLAREFPVHDHDVIFVADAASRPVYQFFGALSRITGAVGTIIVTCQNAKC